MKKIFKYGDKVKVTLPKKTLYGKVYSEYTNPRSMRRICVQHKNGCGIAYPVMFVEKI